MVGDAFDKVRRATLPASLLAGTAPLLAAPLRIVPHALQRTALAPLLEHLFTAEIENGGLACLERRCLAVEIRDAGWRWPITLAGGRLRVLDRAQRADVTVRGSSDAFVLLAARLEDPDTLFFQRRLVIEGDTELGLELKNVIVGLDEERLAAPLRLVLAGLRRLHGRD
jgi:O2-independent ubiquinone biosynthesis accessory factor UbiT